MKVILLENLAQIGTIGEIIDVKRGFARNYLTSNKKALYASKVNIKEIEKMKTELKKLICPKCKDSRGLFKIFSKVEDGKFYQTFVCRVCEHRIRLTHKKEG